MMDALDEILEQFRTAPNCYSWAWNFAEGASMKIQIMGRWSEAEADQARVILDLISDIIKTGADPIMPPPSEEEHPDVQALERAADKD